MARSRVVEMAEAEAARAEAEEPDDDDGAEDEPADDGGVSQEELDAIEAETEGEFVPLSGEAQQRALELAISTYQEALAYIFGPDFAAYDACPLCSGLGAVAPDTILLDSDTVQCPKCHGHGAFVTESYVDNHLTRQCPRCMGNGYIDKPIEYVPVPVPDVPAPASAVAPAPVPPMPVFDAQAGIWRDPFGNPLGPVAS